MQIVENTALPGAILALILLLTNPALAAMNEANEPVKQLFGAAASNTSEPKEMIQGFFEAIGNNDIDGALSDGETALAFRPDYRPALGMMRMLSYMT